MHTISSLVDSYSVNSHFNRDQVWGIRICLGLTTAKSDFEGE